MRPTYLIPPLIVPQEIGKAVAAANIKIQSVLGRPINYEFGPTDDIIKLLQFNKGAVPVVANYPLVAMFCNPMDVMIKKGGGYDMVATIKKIVIATVTNLPDLPTTRINATFVPILYPIYFELLNQIAQLPTVVVQDPNAIVHSRQDIYGKVQASQPDGISDYLDIIEITNMQLTFNQLKSC